MDYFQEYSSMKKINNRLIKSVKMLRALSDIDLEKPLVNRSILDRIFLM